MKPSEKLSQRLLYYGLLLIILGFIGFLSNPAKAKTALVTGGIFGSISILWSFLCRKNNWSIYAAFITTLLILLATASRAFISWKNVLNDQTDKVLAATLITIMSIASLYLMPTLFRAIKQSKIRP